MLLITYNTTDSSWLLFLCNISTTFSNFILYLVCDFYVSTSPSIYIFILYFTQLILFHFNLRIPYFLLPLILYSLFHNTLLLSHILFSLHISFSIPSFYCRFNLRSLFSISPNTLQFCSYS